LFKKLNKSISAIKKMLPIYLLLLPLFSFSQPLLTIPFTSQPPKIDGKLSPDEWNNSSAIGILTPLGTRNLSPIPTIFYLSYDENNIYIAFSCPSASKPKAQLRERDGMCGKTTLWRFSSPPPFPNISSS